MTQYFKIKDTRLRELLEAEAKLYALEAGGVDNWEWYDVSLEKDYTEIEEDLTAYEELISE